jgi:hypothetical protein
MGLSLSYTENRESARSSSGIRKDNIVSPVHDHATTIHSVKLALKAVPPSVRDLRGVIEREKAEIGVLISMEPPTKPMMKEAAEAGCYQPPGLTDKYPRIQILSVAELLAGKKIEYPRLLDVTFKKAPKARKAAEEQMPLGGAEIEEPF